MTLTTPPVIVLYVGSLLAGASALTLTIYGYLPGELAGTIVGLSTIPLAFSACCFETGYMCWPHPWRAWLTGELQEDYQRIRRLSTTDWLLAAVETVAAVGVITRMGVHLLATLEMYGPERLEDYDIDIRLTMNPVTGEHTRIQDFSMRAYTGLLGLTILITAPPSLTYPWWANTVYTLNLAVLIVDPLLGIIKPRLATETVA